jgi:hypothetical protein
MRLINLLSSPRRYNRVISQLEPSKPTHTMIYRGSVYEAPKDHPYRPSPTPAELKQLLGKELIYRGANYIIERGKEIIPSYPQVAQRLIYRGTTYMRYS